MLSASKIVSSGPRNQGTCGEETRTTGSGQAGRGRRDKGPRAPCLSCQRSAGPPDRQAGRTRHRPGSCSYSCSYSSPPARGVVPRAGTALGLRSPPGEVGCRAPTCSSSSPYGDLTPQVPRLACPAVRAGTACRAPTTARWRSRRRLGRPQHGRNAFHTSAAACYATATRRQCLPDFPPQPCGNGAKIPVASELTAAEAS